MAPATRPSNCRFCVTSLDALAGLFTCYHGFPIPTSFTDLVSVVAATLLARLGEGTATFELLEDPAPAPAPPVWTQLHFFARIGSSLYVRSFSASVYFSCLNRSKHERSWVMITGSRSRRGGWSAALNKVEHYGVQRVTGDGRCMFRALVSLRNFCCCGHRARWKRLNCEYA
jgi:hypothetical protein